MIMAVLSNNPAIVKTVRESNSYIIVIEGPNYGFKLKINKGTYMIGRCATTEEALQ